jgi:hypothetical protein
MLTHLKSISHGLRNVGPYLLVELLVPGGTLIALLLWLSQHGYMAKPYDPARSAKPSPAAKVLALD